MKAHVIHCIAGGCIIGYRDEDQFGNPLTRKTANKLAKEENDRSERRRKQKLPGCFDYVVTSFDRKEPK